MKAIITVGISASGKTTWAKEYAKKHNTIISNRDDLRLSLTGSNGWGEYKFDKTVENFITELQKETLELCAADSKDVIISDTNLDVHRREVLVGRCKDIGYEVEIKTFPITLEEAWRRDALRPNGVGRDVIYKQWIQWREFIGAKTYTPNENLPKAVIFDIDGTLARMNGRRPFQWDKVDTDLVDPMVQMMFWGYQQRGYKTIILSGRDGCCYEQTFNWLVDNGITPWSEFIMRKEFDVRKDSIIKEEIFWRDIAPFYNVQAVVDDRPQVVRMWHDIGIPKVICVGNPWEEF